MDFLALDLEVGRHDNRLHAFGAVRSWSGKAQTFQGGDLNAALENLDTFAKGADYLLGHNLIAFDLPHLTAAKPGLRLLRLPAVDTLRLNPLAFPRHPYHHLVKHYQDGQLKRGRINDPELDARLCLDVFGDQQKALSETDPDLLTAWHWLTGADDAGAGFDAFFAALRGAVRPSLVDAYGAIRDRLADTTCLTQNRAVLQEVLADTAGNGWGLAYALAWLSVAGGNSVMPPWVRHQFPEAGVLVRRLRDTACTSPACEWCRERHDARKELTRWFGFADFRPEPHDKDGRPMQQAIVEAIMAGQHVLGILPTGTGKSLCYQIPALSRYDKTGALTVVISPLVALMADQVSGLESHGVVSGVTINGMLSMPERSAALERVRLGDASILIVSPEQLRSRTVRRVLEQREIGLWVLDEAHCLSRWGHDFRPDYRYVARFIREKAPDGQIVCLTATAKPEVREDILTHFRDKLGVDLSVFDGGAQRTNLEFVVVPTTGGEKFAHIHQILTADLPSDTPGGAIVYCATRAQTEDIARYLCAKNIDAAHFHAGLSPETKKNVQRRFIYGDLRVIVATNAFGMGIDKPDVRLVIHADIPGSLENYVQEAGRAGRDRETARCVLLYTTDDIERQFGMSARSRLTRPEIHAILKALRNLDRKKRMDGQVVATVGEILGEDEDAAFERDSTTDDTRVRTAISWLEEAKLLTREEDRVQVFPSSLRVGSLEEARAKLAKTTVTADYRRRLLAITESVIDADPDEGISTDELMTVSGLPAEQVRRALHDLERLGIANNDTALTAFVHTGVQHASPKRLDEAADLEHALIVALQEAAPGMGKDETSTLHVRLVTQRLKDTGHTSALPERVVRILRGLALDGRGEEGGKGSLGLRGLGREAVQITLQREWAALIETAERRRAAARVLLGHLLGSLPSGSRGTDLLAETTLGQLLNAIRSDLELKTTVRNPERLLDRALLWLHEQEIIRLNKGLAIFRPAMSIRLSQEQRRFTNTDFTPLKLHYQDQVLQIHVMAEYVQRGLQAMTDALALVMDYFSLKQQDFLRRWLPTRDKEITRQTTPESWRSIVEDLKNPVQQRIVADDREQTSVLVLAGPGSGKTRVLVHRIAYLLRVRRENPRGILALAYNRHAAVEIRRRLAELLGDDARGVTVLTCHGFAMRLVGASFSGRAERLDNDAFREILRQAVDLLRGAGLPANDADEQRARLLAGFRWILVDEYQDIGPEQYELISALAGRTLADEDDKLSLFAVGDDDQNIYAFDGASVEFIKRFEADYRARPAFLTDNYRSTAHIIAAANTVIEPAARRMKSDHPIHIDRARAQQPLGGVWEELDLVSRGRVQIIPIRRDPIAQAQAAIAELQRLSALSADWDWSGCAVIAREWRSLEPVRAGCEVYGIPVQMGNEEIPGFWRLRETQALLAWLRRDETDLVDRSVLSAWLDAQVSGRWTQLLREAIDEYALETGGTETPLDHFIEWLAEWGRDVRRRQRGLLLLSAHRAKGLEFDHVVVLDGGWNSVGRGEDADAPRRLYYVAMTRARQTLALTCFERSHSLQTMLHAHPSVLHRPPVALPPPTPEMTTRYQRLSLRDVDLGFAGRQPASNPVQRAITALSPGDPLRVRTTQQPWLLLDRAGNVVGRLAKGYTPPDAMRLRSATALAVVTRSRTDSEPQYQDALKCEKWEVVVPELVFQRAG